MRWTALVTWWLLIAAKAASGGGGGLASRSTTPAPRSPPLRRRLGAIRLGASPGLHALDDDSMMSGAWGDLAMALQARAKGDHSTAIARLERVLWAANDSTGHDVDGGDGDRGNHSRWWEVRRLRTHALFHLGDARMQMQSTIAPGDSLEAAEAFTNALALHAEAAVLTPSEVLHAWNSLGVLALGSRDLIEAARCFERARAMDERAPEPLGNLAMVYWGLGQLDSAAMTMAAATQRRPGDYRLHHNLGGIYHDLDDLARARRHWQQALALNPQSAETMSALAMLHGEQGEAAVARELLDRAQRLLDEGPEPPMGSRPRELYHSLLLQRAMSELKLIYDSREDVRISRRAFEARLQMVSDAADVRFADPFLTLGAGSMGYYAIYQGKNDLGVRARLASIYRRATPMLSYVAPHVQRHRQRRLAFDRSRPLAPEEEAHSSEEGVVVLDRRIRVGFLSNFLWHHSVGLLISEVMLKLDRRRFEVVMITFESSRVDDLTKRLFRAVDRHLQVPRRNLPVAQRRVGELELDVLVFGEIGMDASTYFLAFAQLALRTVAFWGHAITSGIDTVDYFVSSVLFRPEVHRPDRQDRYAECLFEMTGLTTAFPKPPQLALTTVPTVTRASLNLPTRDRLAYMLLVPQTLYKLHPDFDLWIERILSKAPGSFMVFLRGNKGPLAEQLKARWRQSLSPAVYQRVFFIGRLTPKEFLEMCAMSDMVLDPFPVGGGRSAFEILSTGTPILGSRRRTSILQLTTAMYRVMGLEGCCMFDDDDTLIENVIRLLHDPVALSDLRQQIRLRAHRLYDDVGVVREWESFLARILATDPPARLSSAEFADGRRRQGNECPAVVKTTETLTLESTPLPQDERRCLWHTLVTLPQSFRGENSRNSNPTAELWLFDGDDPFVAADRFAARVEPPLDLLQTAFLGKLMWNMVHRTTQPQAMDIQLHVAVPHLTSPRSITMHVHLRRGDDIHQVVRWEMTKTLSTIRPTVNHQQFDGAVAEAIAMVVAQVPEHSSDEWILARSMPSDRGSVGPVTRRDCVALVVTTCRRLQLFQRTIRSLQRSLRIRNTDEWRHWFCELVVVDDNSSENDRNRMRREFPQFTFVMKDHGERGHAKSLNLAIARIRARFMFYLEDDWEFEVASCPDLPGCFLLDALAVLRATPLTQVLINYQHSGWARVHEYEALSGLHREAKYLIHEFGITTPGHSFAHWPGFSLNPAIWDLDKLAPLLLGTDAQGHGGFDEESDIFERLFSLQVWRAGLRIGYLDQVYVRHIGAPPGTNASAYVLNGLPRRFDVGG